MEERDEYKRSDKYKKQVVQSQVMTIDRMVLQSAAHDARQNLRHGKKLRDLVDKEPMTLLTPDEANLLRQYDTGILERTCDDYDKNFGCNKRQRYCGTTRGSENKSQRSK